MLTTKQRAFLRSRAHALQPRLQLGKAGVSDGFVRELEQALARDELVKVRIGRLVETDLAAVAAKASAELVGSVGRVAIFYRKGAEPAIELPEGD